MSDFTLVGESIAITDLPPLPAAQPDNATISRAITAILRYDCEGQALTMAGIQSRLRMTVTDAQLLHVLRTMRRHRQPRFTATEHDGKTFWRLTVHERRPE